MRFMMTAIVGALVFMGSPASADDFDRDTIRGEIYCFPTKYASELVEKLDGADADRKDVVESKLAPRFRIFDGGRVPDFLSKTQSAPDGSDLCIKDVNRVGRPGDDEGLYFEMGLTPKFKNRSGSYTYDELKEGTKDGKHLVKKMIPAVARLFMPDTDHLSLRYDDINTPLQITAFKDGEALPPIETEFYNEAHVFDLGDLKDMGADRLVIAGGPYQLSPVPSIKTMRKFGIGEKNVTTKEASNVE